MNINQLDITYKALLILLFLGFANIAFGQDPTLLDFNTQRLQINRTAMTVLGGWAIGNLASGALLTGQKTGKAKYFHQMNLGWGTINLGIAAFAYYSAIKTDPSSLDLLGSFKEQETITRILLFNAGLDVGYIMGGAYLWERAKTTTKNPERLAGFGESIMLQGAFLLVFDLAVFWVHHQHGKDLHPLIGGLSFSGNGLSWRMVF